MMKLEEFDVAVPGRENPDAVAGKLLKLYIGTLPVEAY
jgi:hypothetical protein